MTNFIEQLCMADGISGREGQVRERIIRRIDGHCEWKVDARGNLLCHKKGKNLAAKKVMITAHMDEAGFMLTGIRPDGLLSFANVGDLDSRVVLGKAVRIDGKTIGVIGTKPIHLQTKDEQDRPVPFDKLYIDIGASTRESAQQTVTLGAQITFAGEGTAAFGDGYLTGKAMESRALCALLAELLRREWEFDIDAVFTTSALTMTSGAANAAFALRPDAAIVLESTTAGDVAGVPAERQACRMGHGAVVSFMDRRTIYDRGLYELALDSARKAGVAAQPKQAVAGGNDAGVIHQSRGGVRTIAVSLPCRYLHTPVGLIAKSDYEAVLETVRVLAGRIAGGEG